jgi:hypothetical protein
VVILSMTASDVEDSRRGLDFIFDTNRLNVAISRAQALAIVVANPGLAGCRVTSIKQMAKANFYLRLVVANEPVADLVQPYILPANDKKHSVRTATVINQFSIGN